MLYQERITQSTAFILLETNSSEVKEYLVEYFDSKILIWLVVILVPSYFILAGVNRLIHQYTFREVLLAIRQDFTKLVKGKSISYIQNWLTEVFNNKIKKIVFGLVVLIFAISIYFKDNHHKYFSVYQLYSGYESYLEEVEKYKKFLNSEINNDVEMSIKSSNPTETKETYVLIIGESTTRNHLGIYNYYRNTTPKLNEIKGELVIFDNVISPHTHTIASLEKVLTFGNKENPEAKFDGSIIQLMKKAGYKTFWVSNQVPVGINETMVAMIAKASDYSHFTNLGGERELRSLDEKVLPYFKKVLADKSLKKFIVVHLLGTHTNYKNRYPQEFNQFTDVPKTSFPSEKSHSSINEYDNAVMYNDYILSEIINNIKRNLTKDEKAYAIYISDHGEDVFETVNFTGLSESIGSEPMFQIPFVYWSNNKSNIEKYKEYSGRKYMTDDLIYSIADLSNITFSKMRKEKSIFNDSLQNRRRIVKNNINYDD
ncbi:MAG: sulfatase-like hydrolase/transferase [Flavobacteriales bacterium]|nr:sulfatase-like hydrolase/transferase [Flavobacteriales bacterium]